MQQLPSVQEMEAYIRQAANARGIDPDIAVRVARSEGLAPDTWQSNVRLKYGREQSYGPFQLHVAPEGYRPGMGNDFVKATGLNPADPSTWKQGVDFALDNAAKGGWGPWFGRKNVGVGAWDGIAGAQPLGVSPAAPPVPQGAGPGRGTMAGYQKPGRYEYDPTMPFAQYKPGEEITFYADNSPALPQGGAGTAMGGFMGGPGQVAARQPGVQILPAVGQQTADFRPSSFQQLSARQAMEGDPSQRGRLLEAAGLDPTGKKRLNPRGMNNPGLLDLLQKGFGQQAAAPKPPGGILANLFKPPAAGAPAGGGGGLLGNILKLFS